MVVINESDMQFGDYPDDDIFNIEKSCFYKKRCLSNGVKTCEFILFKCDKVYFVEAKTTSPCPMNNHGNVTRYVEEIVQKMRDSLSIYISTLLRCSDDNYLPKKNFKYTIFQK